MKKMMKMFVLVMLFVMMITTAYAASECSLCGRNHELTADGKCPEACTVAHHGNEHHYYECSEPVVCGVCGQTDHNTNTCPGYDASWIDATGTWKKDKYLNGQEARKPIWCGLCAHYGYHYDWECKKAPRPTATPKPTNTPRPTATPCTHNYVEYQAHYDKVMCYTPDICYIEYAVNGWKCTYCGEVASDTYETTNEVPHAFHNYVCECGYDVTPVTPNPTATPTPIPTATPTPQPTATPIPTVVPCSHVKQHWEYTGAGQYWMCDDVYCFTAYTRKVCEHCGKVDETIVPKNIEHNYNAQKRCGECGYVHSNYSATPTPLVTVAPTQAPCQHTLDVRMVYSEYDEPLMKDDLVCAQGKVIYHVNCILCGEFIRQYEVPDSKEHNYNAQKVCSDCGYVHSAYRVVVTPKPSETPVVVIVATAEPTMPTVTVAPMPPENPILETIVGLEWWQLAMIIVAIILLVVIFVGKFIF